MKTDIHKILQGKYPNFSFFILLMTLLLLGSLISNAFCLVPSPGFDQDAIHVVNTGSDSIFYATVFLNGAEIDHHIAYVQRDENILISAESFCEIAGSNYYPFVNNTGLTIQFGKTFSFAVIHRKQGFVACKMVEMLPPVESVNNVVMAPINFLALAINGIANFNQDDNSIYITTSTPVKIGDIISEAKSLADALTNANYLVQQGSIDSANPIQFFYAGYTPDCQGNNVNTPYFLIQTPPSPGMPFVYTFPGIHSMRPDEAFVLIGRTPPECAYFSYRSYLVNRYYENASPHRKKIYASMGDAINAYNIPEGRLNTQSFNRFILIISTADKNIETAIRQAATQAGIDKDDIYVDIYPSEIVGFGLDDKADFYNYIHRTSLFSNQDEQNQYLANPPLEILRITPAIPATPDFIPTPTLRQRGTGTNEFHLTQGFEQLRQEIIDKYSDVYDVTEMPTSVWGTEYQLEGLEAIKLGINTLAEIRDTIYLLTESFDFNQNDVIVVFGVDHTKTNKAVYCNVNCYGTAYMNGVGGVLDPQYKKSAREFLADTLLADNFYIWKFARIALDEHTLVIPPDIDKNFTGIDYGAKALIGFRAYVEPATKVGPSPSEIILDQVILLRQKNTDVTTKEKLVQNSDFALSAYPNPFNLETEIQLMVSDISDVQVFVFNIHGQMVKELFSAANFSGSKNIIWTSEDSNNKLVSSGVYLIKVVFKDQKLLSHKVLCSKVLLIR